MALLAIVGLFLAAVMPDTAPMVSRQGIETSHPTVCLQPEDVSTVALVGKLHPAAAQVELEEDAENGEESERKLKAWLASRHPLLGLHYRLLSSQDRRPDSRTLSSGSQAPDPRPPRA